MTLLVLAPVVAAQESTDPDYTHEYTFNQSRAVVVDGATETIYAGSSGGVFVLDSSDPTDPQPATGVANELRTGGFVRDMALTDDHLYVASHKAGLTRFRRGSLLAEPEWKLGRGTDTTGVTPGEFAMGNTDGWAVTVPTRVGDFDLVFVGTNDEYYAHDGEVGGTLHIAHADTDSLTQDAPDVVASLYLGAPIHTLASMVDGTDVILLIGTECREDNGDPASLIRMEFPGAATTLPTAFPSTSNWDVWPPPSSSLGPRFIRDITIVEFGPGTGVVSAALGCNGVATFLESGSLLSKYPATGLAPSAFMDVEAGEDGNLYCTTMDGRLWVFDPTNMAVPLAIFETPGQGAFLEGATSTGSGSPPPPAFYLSDFRTGVHRVQLQSVPGS